ncbi:MAG: biotin--[acetyl-CoA-carboxylase] ligase [Candidatus Rokubacteria bacterium]|nr:biotin--[acetyl-CoA-carboxylase] ligase [Candidatus Rokubacteria bacterium]
MNLDLGSIQKCLQAKMVGSEWKLLAAVPSTNAALRALAQAGAPEGTVLLAEEQTAGHGRLGRPWFSPPGVNLYASVLFRPAIPPREVPGFAFVSSLALTDAIRAEGLAPAIKWPNDVLVDTRKVAGSLAECASSGPRADWVIVGVGVNVNVTRAALRAALGAAGSAAGSRGGAAGREIDRNAFAAAFLGSLDRWAATHAAEGPEPLLQAWRDRDILTGRRVEVRGEGEPWTGRVLGVDHEGYLVLRDARGARRRVFTGEVRVAD